MLPCALDYLVPPRNMLTLGRTVSLHGKGLQRLTDIRAGFPFYVWPSTPDCEPDLLNAGLTCLSDHSSPEFVTYPNGGARWPRPATQPLDADVTATLARADADDDWRPAVVRSAVAPFVRAVVVSVVVAQCPASSPSSPGSGVMIRSSIPVNLPGAWSGLAFSSVGISAKLGVGGGEDTIHSNDQPPHGSAGAF